MVRQLENSLTQNDQNQTLSFAYGIAGDSYMAVVQVKLPFVDIHTKVYPHKIPKFIKQSVIRFDIHTKVYPHTIPKFIKQSVIRFYTFLSSFELQFLRHIR